MTDSIMQKSRVSVIIESKPVVFHPNSFHNTMSFVLLVSQYFGIMPLYGITNKDYRNVKFRWKSLRFCYTVFNMSGGFTCAIFGCIQFAKTGISISETGTLSFYICNFFATLYFAKLGLNWTSLIREWIKVENSMSGYGYPSKLKRNFKITTVTILSFALILKLNVYLFFAVEHLLFIFNAMNSVWSCNQRDVKVYYTFAFPQIFRITAYKHWKAPLVEIANILSTFCWNFLDLFIILISSALAVRFKQISKKMKNTKVFYDTFWKQIREDYDKLASLCALTDNYIGPLVTISFISNLFFICVQLYNSLKPRYGILPTVYFFYSFGFVLTRTVAVSLYAAWINDESKKPLKILHSVSSEHYCIDIERLIQQIHTNPVGITGSNFFLITRSFLLQIAGTIVTFELMLLQFGPLMQNDVSNSESFYTEEYLKGCTSFK